MLLFLKGCFAAVYLLPPLYFILYIILGRYLKAFFPQPAFVFIFFLSYVVFHVFKLKRHRLLYFNVC